eukprot:TRINITY_DN14333_c0_g1_i1.p1 TRINITY_DN14333_c0_g1~~TRINITY_DN14333_c0_g1_i1.p1  ORF type:complete len:320 (+),score=66.80 TRINITY_DN14333_c0_g1_i1:52-1011(+)
MVKFEQTQEQTFIAIKPDGVQRGLVGDIIRRFENRGLKMAACKMIQVTEQHAKKHYEDLAKKPFYADLCKFICSGPMVAMVWQGLNACKTGRMLLGETNPADSLPGTIRGDYAVDIGRNVCHGSDSVESAKKEISLWFSVTEINSWTACQESWVYELPAGAAAPAAAASSEKPKGTKVGTLEVTLDKANMKNSDAVAECSPQVRLRMAGQDIRSSRKTHTLTPEWDETYQMDVYDILNDKLTVTAYLGEDEAGEGFLLLDKLIKGKSTYKGVAVKGGRLDMTLKALDFGAAEKEEEEDGDWMDFCGEGDMAGADSDDEA